MLLQKLKESGRLSKMGNGNKELLERVKLLREENYLLNMKVKATQDSMESKRPTPTCIKEYSKPCRDLITRTTPPTRGNQQ